MIRKLLMEKVHHVIEEYTSRRSIRFRSEKVRKKKESCQKRHAEIVKVDATGKVHSHYTRTAMRLKPFYMMFTYKYLIKQGAMLYLEEEVENRRAVFYNDKIYEDGEIQIQREESVEEEESSN